MADQNPSELADLDTQINQLDEQIDELRRQVGGQSDGPLDPEDAAAALNNVEELQGAREALVQRRDRLTSAD